MYHKLMGAFLRYRMGEETNHISMMDSLCTYYDHPETKIELILSQLITGDAYRQIKEYPPALLTLMQRTGGFSLSAHRFSCVLYFTILFFPFRM